MKKQWVIGILSVVLAGAVMFMMQKQSSEPIVYDDEQKGVNKQIVI